MAKKLTASELNKLSAKFNNKTTIRILDGEFEVAINDVFRDTDIDNVVLNYLTVLQEVNRKEQITDELLKDTVSLLNTFVLREFTDLPIPKKNDIASLIKVTKNLMDNGITNEVLNHFPIEQLAKVEIKLKQAQKGIGKVMGDLALTSTVKSGANNEDQG